MTRNEIILDGLRREMEEGLKEFSGAALTFGFEARLKLFLKRWEENFAPYTAIKFDYRIDGTRLDINATIPEPARYIIELRRSRLRLDPAPLTSRPRNRK